MAEEKKETPMLDPIAYRSDYNPNDIDPEYRNDPNLPWVWPLNANENYQEYWDDSNPAWQGQKGWLNPKYEWEGVLNTYIDYNPNLRTWDLDPNYLFWENARQQNAKEKWYIARRNDMIASALYNEWKTSREDIANYLAGQKGWFDSTESDRLNTIDSIWKRLWQQWGDKGTYKADESNADSIIKDGEREGTIYGKTSADNTNPEKWINTLSDANSPYTIMEEARAANLKTLIWMPIEDIATALDEWLLPSDLQSIRDYQQYYPELWAEVKQYQKKIKTQNTVDAISNGWEISTENNGQSVINNSIAEFSNKNAWAIKSSQEISQDVRDSLAKNQTASEASETMASIEEDMAILKNRLSNLRQEANSKFKWDVPDYLVRAYVANKTQEIQNQMSILENRYNMAMNRYKTEVANTQWEKEYALKVQELQLKQDSAALNDWATKQNIAIKWAELGKDDKAKTDPSGYEVSTMSDDAIASVIDYLMDMYDNHQLGNAQCAAWIQKYYLPLLWISLPNLSDYQNKLKLINEGKDYMPKKWDLIIFSDFADEHGHIWIVTATNEFNEWEITYLDWNGSVDANWEWTEAVKARVINIKDKKIMWFRNINKWSSSSSSSKEWSDIDYTNFTNFLDSNNKDITDSDRKSIAAMYWFDKDDLEWMRNFANEQLKNRDTDSDSNIDITTNKWTYSVDEDWRTVLTKPDWTKVTYAYWVVANDPRIEEPWFNPELWFNPRHKKIYEKMDSWDTSWDWIAKQAESLGRTVKQLWQEKTNYLAAKEWWFDAFNDETRWVDKDFWFVIDKKEVYQNLNKAIWKTWQIAWTQKASFLNQLWLDPKDPKAESKMMDELAAFNRWSNEALKDENVNMMVHALEYLMQQNSTRSQRRLAMDETTLKILWQDIKPFWWLDRLFSGEANTWRAYYNFIKSNQALDALADSKSKWATLTPMSDKDFDSIKQASSLLDYTSDKDEFRYAVETYYNALRDAIWKEKLSQEELDKMWNSESHWNYDNYLTLWAKWKKKVISDTDEPIDEEEEEREIPKNLWNNFWSWSGNWWWDWAAKFEKQMSL